MHVFPFHTSISLYAIWKLEYGKTHWRMNLSTMNLPKLELSAFREYRSDYVNKSRSPRHSLPVANITDDVLKRNVKLY